MGDEVIDSRDLIALISAWVLVVAALKISMKMALLISDILVIIEM